MRSILLSDSSLRTFKQSLLCVVIVFTKTPFKLRKIRRYCIWSVFYKAYVDVLPTHKCGGFFLASPRSSRFTDASYAGMRFIPHTRGGRHCPNYWDTLSQILVSNIKRSNTISMILKAALTPILSPSWFMSP